MLFSYFITHALSSFGGKYLTKGVLNIRKQMFGQVNEAHHNKTCSLVHVDLPVKVSQPVFLTFHE